MKKNGCGQVSYIATHKQDVSQDETQKAGESDLRGAIGNEGQTQYMY